MDMWKTEDCYHYGTTPRQIGMGRIQKGIRFLSLVALGSGENNPEGSSFKIL